MAKISDRKPKSVSGGYSRILGNKKLGMLISKVHATSCSDGAELERIVTNMVQRVPNLDKFLEREILPEGVFLATKKQVKTSCKLDSNNFEPDFIVFKRRKGQQQCHVIELKAGHAFDTKKASGERGHLHRFVEKNARHMRVLVSLHFCAFYQEDRNVIWEGFKKKISLDEVMTGREFCELLEIDYGEIVSIRQSDAKANFKYFVTEILRIREVRDLITELEDDVKYQTEFNLVD